MTGLETIALAGCVAGVLDISATSTIFVAQGLPLERLLQGIASGALGISVFKGGKRTAALGLFFHFLIALTAAAVYYAASRRLLILTEHPIALGALFGIAVHLVMSSIIVPLSRAPKRKFSAKAFFIQLVVHIVFVGLPIALIISHSSR